MTEEKPTSIATRMRAAVARWGDACAVIALMALAAVLGATYLFSHVGILATVELNNAPSLFEPSAMLAAGYGFTVPVNAEDFPALRDFLEHRTGRITRDQIPEKLDTRPPDDFTSSRLYLLHAVGFIWRLTGISWEALKILPVLIFAALAGLVYGVFRLAMNRRLSLAGTLLYLLSPGVYAVITNLRDFSKGPFVLAVLLIVGHLVKRLTGRRAYLGWAALLGVVAGVGVGFRHDVLICLPPAVCVVLAAQGVERLSVWRRGAAAALLLVCFALAAVPVFASYPILPSTEAMHSESHVNVNMGFATVHDDEMGMARASYERVPLLSDAYEAAISRSYDAGYDAYVAGAPGGPRDETAPRASSLMVAMLKTFPADMLLRGYAATFQIARGPEPESRLAHIPENAFTNRLISLNAPVQRHFRRFGLWYAGAALVVTGCLSLRLGFAALVLVLYFGAYPSLQYQFRHVYHLGFVPFWFAGLTLAGAFHVLGALRRAEVRRSVLTKSWWIPRAVRSAAFVAGVLVLVLLPLHGLRIYQRHILNDVLAATASAGVRPIETTRAVDGKRVYFKLCDPLFPLADPLTAQEQVKPHVGWRPAYLVAAFSKDMAGHFIELHYDAAHTDPDFSQVLMIGPERFGAHGNARSTAYFFPVFEYLYYGPGSWWSQFTGISLSKDDAEHFEGLLRIQDPARFPLLIHLTVPGAPEVFRSCQQLRPAHRPLPELPVRAKADSSFSYYCALAAEAAGDPARAAEVYREALAEDPSSIEFSMGLGRALAAQGDRESALAAFCDAIDLAPEFYVPYAKLAGVLAGSDSDARIGVWRALAERHARRPCPLLYLGRALAEAEHDDEAIEAYERALGVSGHDWLIRGELAGLLVEQGRLEEAAGAYRAALAVESRAAMLHDGLGRVLVELGEPEEAIAACGRAVELDPKRAHPLATALATAAPRYMKEGNWEAGAALYRAALDIRPDMSWAKSGLGICVGKMGDFGAALKLHREALADYLDDRGTYGALDETLRDRNDPEARVAEWERIAREHPDIPFPSLYLGMAREQEGDIPGALEAFERADALGLDGPDARDGIERLSQHPAAQ